jgi:hypothetical protein
LGFLGQPKVDAGFALSGPVRLPDGRHQILLLAEGGRRFGIELATDVGHWVEWTNFLTREATAPLLDEAPNPVGRRFYRAVAP